VSTSAKVMTLVVASHNVGKLAEIRAILRGLPVDVRAVGELGGEPLHVVEDGETFEANALLKARAVAAATHLTTLADDSGLEVDALGGRPGVRSARFAGESATDADNNAALLGLLQDVDESQRTARFRCTIALVDPWDRDHPIVVDGRCEGTIARSPKGAGGFGYDPLFLVAGTDQTMAELAADDKNRISHRARALAALRPELEALVERKLAETRAIGHRALDAERASSG
jgi:XTP/dITP diphosphohydrolase